jgi:hypothetical protein
MAKHDLLHVALNKYPAKRWSDPAFSHDGFVGNGERVLLPWKVIWINIAESEISKAEHVENRLENANNVEFSETTSCGQIINVQTQKSSASAGGKPDKFNDLSLCSRTSAAAKGATAAATLSILSRSEIG